MCTPIKIFACPHTILSLIRGPGWDGDFTLINRESYQKSFDKLRKKLSDREFVLYTTPSIIQFIHLFLQKEFDTKEALISISVLAKFSSCNFSGDYDLLIQQSLTLVIEQQGLELCEVFNLLLAKALDVDFFIAHVPDDFQGIVNCYQERFGEFSVPVVQLEELLVQGHLG
jgi:hypothetical protein